MAELYERIESLCKEKGVSITEMCKQSGASRGSLTDLKMGRIGGLSLETLEKLMKYFGISLTELLGEETKKAPSDDGVMDSFTYAAHGYSGRLTDADKATLIKMMETLAAANEEGHGQANGGLSRSE